jgi:hypothetical protein
MLLMTRSQRWGLMLAGAAVLLTGRAWMASSWGLTLVDVGLAAICLWGSVYRFRHGD